MMFNKINQHLMWTVEYSPLLKSGNQSIVSQLELNNLFHLHAFTLMEDISGEGGNWETAIVEQSRFLWKQGVTFQI